MTTQSSISQLLVDAMPPLERMDGRSLLTTIKTEPGYTSIHVEEADTKRDYKKIGWIWQKTKRTQWVLHTNKEDDGRKFPTLREALSALLLPAAR